jgi:glycosyltransferase involved in cell wall biosynthesis
MTRILIDLQACQNGSRFRGLGRYTKNLAREIAKQTEFGSVHLLLNGVFEHTILPLRQYFADFVPEQNIHVVQLLDRAKDCSEGGRWRKKASALLREAYIEMLAPNVIFHPSFFEGYNDDAVVSVHRLSSIPVVGVLHDLIPLIFEDRYLKPDADFARHYRDKVVELKHADGLIAISESSLREAIDLLGYPASRAMNASEGAESTFRMLDLSLEQKAALRTKFGVAERFIFYTGGADPRKNLDGLIRAFARVPESVRSGRQLVLAGDMSDEERRSLQAIARGVGLTELMLLGFVTDADLVELYNLCEVFVLPSLHEGFGLPCLEAMQCGAPVIGSNISSIPEVLGNPNAMFDPHAVDDIARVLERALTDAAFRSELIETAKREVTRFSWESSAQKTLGMLKAIAAPSATDVDWISTQARLDNVEAELVRGIRALIPQWHPTATDLAQVAQAVAGNRIAVTNRLRPYSFSEQAAWRIEGPFDSSYSLSLVNRELALALERQGENVGLHAAEGPGDYEADKRYLAANSDVAALHERSLTQEKTDVVTRNMYPPRVTNMNAPLNGLSSYAWEETGFPFRYAEGFNENLQFLTVTSKHVKKILIDAGVSVPITVVGNGVDHWLRIKALPFEVRTAKHTFLHVSSCFPRKGADVLLKSYGQAFTKADDVLLIVKTFENPHNTIRLQLAELQADNPDYPAVHLLMNDLSEGELKTLYEKCDTLVAPSRAEGFGLPIAEAMLSGLHVITTAWSGQMDFCTPENASLIDYAFALANTHEEGKSVSAWAEPDVSHLSRLMRDAVKRKQGGDAGLLPRWSWDEVARRTRQAARETSVEKLIAEPRLGWVTTYRKRCGIATYSEHLIDMLDMPSIILADCTDDTTTDDSDSNIVRCWREGKTDDFSDLLAAIDAHQLDAIVIQFNYGFFDLKQLGRLIHHLCDAKKCVIITLHATIDPPHDPSRKLSIIVDALARCDRLLVHSVQDLNRLKAHGLIDNVGLFPHGVLVSRVKNDRSPLAEKTVRLASYGFFLPNKGLVELIEAAHILKAAHFAFRLDLVNAAYPTDISYQLIEQARRLIQRYGLGSEVRLITDFLPDQESLALLSEADIVLYPYQRTAESASGAVRYGLAAGKAVAVTPLPIFDDVASCVFTLPGFSPPELAEGIVALTEGLRSKRQDIDRVMERAQRWRDVHAYPVLGRRMSGIIRGLYRERITRSSVQD